MADTLSCEIFRRNQGFCFLHNSAALQHENMLYLLERRYFWHDRGHFVVGQPKACNMHTMHQLHSTKLVAAGYCLIISAIVIHPPIETDVCLPAAPHPV